jgi:hypothetical protein
VHRWRSVAGTRRLAGTSLSAATLLALAGVCFARLVADPAALIVDGRRPSVDYANRGEPRPIGNDLTFLFLPHHWSIGRRWEQFGHFPLWDARGFGGRPLVGNPQGGMFYPPVWAAWWLRDPAALGWLTVAHLLWGGFGVAVLLRSMGQGHGAAMVAAGTYQASPLLLAHTFEGHYPHVWAACWYPWAFWAYGRLRAGRTPGLVCLPLILALTALTGHPQEWLLLVLALSGWALADALRPRPGRGWIPYPRRNGVLVWAGVLVVSTAMAAVDLAPQWSVRPWVRRNRDPAREAAAPMRHHLTGLNAFQLLSPAALGGPADYFGNDNYWETVFSIGLIPLVLSGVAVARHPDRRLVGGWLMLAGLSVWFACGRHLGFARLVDSVVPGMGWFRVPARSLLLANLAGAVLAGLGLETLRTRLADRRGWRRLALGLAVITLAVVGGLIGVRDGRAPVGPLGRSREGTTPRPHPRWDPPSESEAATAPRTPPAHGRARRAALRVLHDRRCGFALGGLAATLAAGCLASGRRTRSLAGGLLGLLGLCELGWAGFDLIQVAPAGQFLGPDPIGGRELLGARRLKPASTPAAPENPAQTWGGWGRRPQGDAPSESTRSPHGRSVVEDAVLRPPGAPNSSFPVLPPRIKARDSFYGDLPAAVHGVEKTNIGDAFQLDHAAALYEAFYPVASHRRPMAEWIMSPSAKESWRRIRRSIFDRMSVTLLISDRIEPDPSWPVAAVGTWNGSPYVIQRNPTAMPRAYVVPRATLTPNHPGVMLPSFCDLDPHRSVLMSRDPLVSLPPGPRQPFTAAEWTSIDPDRPALVVTTRAPGLLVVAETWMPGWTATVGGRPAPVLRGNYAQRVIPLPEPGRHTIVMEYRPPGFGIGCAITAATILAWGLFCALVPFTAARAPRRPDGPAARS